MTQVDDVADATGVVSGKFEFIGDSLITRGEMANLNINNVKNTNTPHNVEIDFGTFKWVPNNHSHYKARINAVANGTGVKKISGNNTKACLFSFIIFFILSK